MDTRLTGAMAALARAARPTRRSRTTTFDRRAAGCLAVALLCWLGLSVAASADAKLAFVVGVDSYSNLRPEFQLERPSSDADAVAQTLTGLGYQVSLLTRTVTQETLLRRFTEFATRIQPGDTVMFYFAGHGIALENTNYLLPSDIPALESGQELLARTRSLAETDVRQLIRDRGARVVVMVIDACRDNPFPRPTGTRGLGQSRGLVPAEPADGVFTLYSAALGQQALDRLPGRDDSRNSVFTRIFVAELKKPGQNLIDLGENVRDNVSALAETAQLKQNPAYYNEVRGARRIFLGGPAASAADAAAAPQASAAAPGIAAAPGVVAAPGVADKSTATAAEVELAFWASVKDSRNPKGFEAYLQRYPAGLFSEIAHIRLDATNLAASKPLDANPAARTVLAGAGLAELRDRLYELNFDPDANGARSLETSIREFEEQSRLPITGVPTDGLLQRLRDLGGVKPWGAIVYDKTDGRWGMGWDHTSRRAAVADARSKCGGAACRSEISFFGSSCGAFALSSSTSNWSLVARGNAGVAGRAALEDCGRRGRACRIIGAVCADGSGRVVQ